MNKRSLSEYVTNYNLSTCKFDRLAAIWSRPQSMKPRSQHINAIHFKGPADNNKMERINGEIRDREKTMRRLETKITPILQGMQIYHNYIRPHEGLDGKTPAEACGIKIEGDDKWMTLIRNASKKTKAK